MKTELILAGGFLGAGKTTLLNKTAQILTAKGKQTGLIANDQATGLVDFEYFRKDNGRVEEVSGSCFCCNYNGFTDAVKKLANSGAQIILAEPVGSCADLSATILQPLKDKKNIDVDLKPFTVVADPGRLEALLSGKDTGLHPSAAYIFDKQLDEADLILINKADLLSEEKMKSLIEAAKKRYSGKPILAASAKTGKGIEEWLAALAEIKKPGQTITEVDYDVYAEGEAVLGWLNMELNLQKAGQDWSAFGKKLMTDLANKFQDKGMRVAHMKILLTAGGSSLMANLTGGPSTLVAAGEAGKSDSAQLIVNARVESTPDDLLNLVKKTIEEQCQASGVQLEIPVCKCLQPGRPNPTHRYSKAL